MLIQSSHRIQRLKSALVASTAVFCLLGFSLAAKAQLGMKTVQNETELNKALGNERINKIRLKKGSRIKLTSNPPQPKNIIRLEGQIDKDTDGKIIETTRAWIHGDNKHSIRLDDNNPDLDSISHIGFEHGRGAEPDWGDDINGKNNFGGGAFYIPENLKNGIESSIFTSNESTKSGGVLYIGGDFIGGINNSQFKSNRADWGGAIYVRGDFAGDISNSIFEHNDGKTGGGGIYVKNTLTGDIINSTFSDNYAFGQFGGAVYANEFDGTITNSTFTGNRAAWQGGAIYVEQTFSGGIENSRFLKNIGGNGGAFSANIFEGDIDSSHFEKNSGSAGGAIFLDDSFHGNIISSIFIDNKSDAKNGGAISIADLLEGNISEGSRFEKNKAKLNGGAIYAGQISGDIENSSFIDNSAQDNGGAIYADLDFEGSIIGSTFKDNKARAGGAIYINEGSLIGQIEDSQFINNRADENGGAIRAFEFDGTIKEVSFENNEASNNGGAIYIEQTLTGGIGIGSSFHDNMATLSGGAIWLSDLEKGISDSIFTDNYAGKNGGALFIDNILKGNIVASEFEGNSAQSGGAIYTNILEGGIESSIFTDNSAEISGGAIYIFDTLQGDIHNSSFINNVAEDGGAIYAGNKLQGEIINSFFRENFSNYLGGAVFAKELDGGVNRSVFTNNAAMGWGGALYIGGIFEGRIANSIFVNNHAGEAKSEKDDNPHALVGLGGALFVHGEGSGNRIVSNSIFLGNSARSTVEGDSYGGLGGAIFHNATRDDDKESILTIDTTDNHRTIFYGNKARRSTETQDRANGIYLGNMGKDDRTTHVNIKTEEGGTLFMFDPLEGQRDGIIDTEGDHYGNLTVDLHKTGRGDWFLGGESLMHGATAWRIDEGALNLTEVDGVAASIALEHDKEARFNLGTDGTLTGTGAISARDITLSGTIAPSSLKKIGMGINDITDETNIALGVNQDSKYGIISLGNDGSKINLKDATFIVDVGDDDNDLIKVKGDLEIEGGVLEVRSHVSTKNEETGSYKQDSYVILKNDGKLSGQFGKVRDDLAFWNTQLDYVNNEIILSFIQDKDGATKECQTINQCHLGEIIKGIVETIKKAKDEIKQRQDRDKTSPSPPTNKQPDKDKTPDNGNHVPNTTPPNKDNAIIDAIIDMSPQERNRAYNNLSGEIYASSRSAILENSHLYRNLVQHMVQRSQNPDNEVNLLSKSALSPMWFSTYAGSGYLSNNPHAARLDTSGSGMVLGLDRADAGETLGGFFLSHETLRLKNGASRNARSDTDFYQIGAYLGGEFTDLQITGGIIYSFLDIKTERDIWVAGKMSSLAGMLTAHYHGHKLQTFTEVAKDLHFGTSLTLSPYWQMSQNFLHTSNAHENGDSVAALDIEKNRDSLLTTTLGIRGFYDLPLGVSTRLYGDIGWSHNFKTKPNKSQHNFRNMDHKFDISGVNLTRNGILVGSGIDTSLTDNLSLDIGYQGKFGHGSTHHNANMQLKFKF